VFSLDSIVVGRFPRVTVAAIFGLFALSGLAASQQASAPNTGDTDEYKISVDVGLVILPVTVTNRKGEFVPNLALTNFQVFEAGHPQQITLFHPEDVPVTVGLVVDNSGSMGAKRSEVVAASLAFVRSSNPGDEMFVVNFNQRVSVDLPPSLPFTSDLEQLRGALSTNRSVGNTALYDGIAVALEHLKAGSRERKALIVVTDGGDNASHMKFQELLKTAQSSNAIIIPLAFLTPTTQVRIPKHSGGSLR